MGYSELSAFLASGLPKLWAAAKVCRIANVMRSYMESL
jgi:hypothetical protein